MTEQTCLTFHYVIQLSHSEHESKLSVTVNSLEVWFVTGSMETNDVIKTARVVLEMGENDIMFSGSGDGTFIVKQASTLSGPCEETGG